jgi:Cof subfamily protein (haloacid dehalogenase superfamily)
MKLIASDYDKTFHRHDDQDLQINLKAVDMWRKNGHMFAISTGRDVASMLHEKMVRNIDYDYLVALNGSFVVDAEHNVLFKQAIDNELARDLVAMLTPQMGEELIISNGFDGYNQCHKSASLTDPLSREVFERNSKIYSKSIETALQSDVFLVGCLSDNFEMATALRDEILSKYAEEVEVFLNLNYINIVPKGISKASGVEVVINHTKIDQQRVAVIGDDLNDIPMLERFNGYAVNNARPEAKAVAVKVYDSVAELIYAMNATA